MHEHRHANEDAADEDERRQADLACPGKEPGEGVCGGVQRGVHHALGRVSAKLLEHGIHTKWPEATVRILPCSGLCSFYAQDQGLIITY